MASGVERIFPIHSPASIASKFNHPRPGAARQAVLPAQTLRGKAARIPRKARRLMRLPRQGCGRTDVEVKPARAMGRVRRPTARGRPARRRF